MNSSRLYQATSTALTGAASPNGGSAISTTIAATIRTRTPRCAWPCTARAQRASLGVPITSVYRGGGDVIMIMIVGMAVMKQDAVSGGV